MQHLPEEPDSLVYGACTFGRSSQPAVVALRGISYKPSLKAYGSEGNTSLVAAGSCKSDFLSICGSCLIINANS